MTTEAGRAAAWHFDLDFAADPHRRSFLAAQFVRYPVHIGRCMYLDEADRGVCTVGLQSASGGLFEGDRLAGRLVARAGARVRVQTSASTVVHSTRGDAAEQRIELAAESGARLSYLPEPLLLFPASRVCSRTVVRAVPGATVVFCDSFLAHDPAARAASFTSLDARVEVKDGAGALLARERLLLTGTDWLRHAVAVSAGFAVHASVWIVRIGDSRRLLAAVRAVLDGAGGHAGASELPHHAGVQVRLLCRDAVAFRRVLNAVFALAEACTAADAPSSPTTR